MKGELIYFLISSEPKNQFSLLFAPYLSRKHKKNLPLQIEKIVRIRNEKYKKTNQFSLNFVPYLVTEQRKLCCY